MNSIVTKASKAWSSSRGNNIPDWSLWMNFRGGDREALESLYCRHGLGMFRYGLHICKDADLVRDGMQDLFGRLWGARARISNADCVQMYLYQSLRRLLLRHIIRKRKRNISVERSGLAEHFDQPLEQRVIDKEICKEQFARLRNEIRVLSKHQREAVVLRFFNGLSYGQIAEIMGLQIDSVYNLISKALVALRSRLNLDNTNRYIKFAR